VPGASRDALLGRIGEAESRFDALVARNASFADSASAHIAHKALREARAWLDFPSASTLTIAESLIDLAVEEMPTLERHGKA
jgi:hypothetical protein